MKQRDANVARLPILCYHNIAPAPPGSQFKLLYVSPAAFERQLWTLRRLGLRGVSLSEGLQQLQSNARSSSVVLTFDDGYLDTATEALPILKRFRFTATCYLVTDCLGSYNRWDAQFLQETKPLMNQDHVQEWLSAGMEIGSHSCSHPRLPELEECQALQEIVASRAALREAFGLDIQHFCYPFGRFTDATAELVRRAGYSSAVSLLPGAARPRHSLYHLPRMLVNGEQSWLRFVFKVVAR
jgi:peptidoglycan/xylan/chitin deacetylase (PgdA/CDA1 family)